jgi:hypothetical protein
MEDSKVFKIFNHEEYKTEYFRELKAKNNNISFVYFSNIHGALRD